VAVSFAGDPHMGGVGGGDGGNDDNGCAERLVSFLTMLCVVAVSVVFSQN